MSETLNGAAFYKRVNKFINENRKIFSISPSRIVSDYQGEESLRKAYAGRQLLEMLQNADDAGAKKVLITHDTVQSQLTFANTGKPFSAEGIGSLMIRDLSTKRGRKKMIGNKGLGFRSILNWATKITIISNGFELVFSPEIAKDEFLQLMSDTFRRNNLLKDHEYPEDAIPFPILGIPNIQKADPKASEWDTQIVIDYDKKRSKKQIGDQLAEFKKEILIFLNSIEELTITTDGKSSIFSSHKQQGDNFQDGELTINTNSVVIEDQEWTVYSLTEVLPDAYQDKDVIDKEYYNLRVAVTNDLTDNYQKLFTYFPTQLSLFLPCLIHGTFELDPSRNHLTESTKNPYHFKQLVKLLAAIAKKLSRESVDWRPYKLLNPLKVDSDDDKIKTFYEELAGQKMVVAAYPCVDAQYRTIKASAFHGQRFSSFIKDNNLVRYFPTVFRPLDDELLEDDFLANSTYRWKADYFVSQIAKAAQSIKDFKVLASLISILVDPSFKKLTKHNYSLLLNKDKVQIPADFVAFTPVSKGKEFSRPSYVKFDFINKTLYDDLLTELNIKGSTHPSRDLQVKLKDNFTIQSYEPAQVIINYISTAKRSIEQQKPSESKKVILEMVGALFVVHKSLFGGTMDENSRVEEVILSGVPLLTKGGKVVNNTELVFGKEYPKGKLTDELFGGIYNADNYLATPYKLALQNEDIGDIETFFSWLKVGNHSQLEKWSERGDNWNRGPFIDYLYKTHPKPELRTSIQAGGFRVKGLEKILSQIGKGISREQIIAWIYQDTKVRQILNFSQDKFYYSYGGHDIKVPLRLNYIQWQFFNSGVFNDYVIADKSLEIINPYQINFHHPLFKSSGMTTSDIEKILLLIGAKQTFEELPVPVVFKILDKLRAEDPEKTGRFTTSVYRLALKNFSEDKNYEAALKHSKGYLFAKRGNERDYKPAQEVYYAENHTLPSKVIESLWMLNYPKRGGEKQIREFLGTKTFESLRPQIVSSTIKINHTLQSGLSHFMTEARVYILAFRIESLKSPEEKQKAADLLSDMEIILADQCGYTVGDNEIRYLGEGEFIYDDDRKYYFRVPQNCTSFTKLERLLEFRDAFSEIFCVLFKLTELKKDFRNIIAVGLKDTKHLLENEYESWILKEALDLTQLNIEELAFWKRIFRFLKIDMPAKGLTKDKFIDAIKSMLNIKIPAGYKQIDFGDFDSDYSVELLTYLGKKLVVPIEVSYPPGLSQYHTVKLRHFLDNYDNVLGFKLWKSLITDIKSQRTFYKKREKYQALKSEWSRKIGKSLQFKIGVDYDKLVRIVILEVFNIMLKQNEEAEETVTMRYTKLRDKFTEEWERLPSDYLSIAFYNGNGERIKTELTRIRALDNPPDEPTKQDPSLPDTDTPERVNATLHFVSLSRPAAKPTVPVTRKSGTRPVFDIRITKNFYNAGKEAEKLVRNKLVEVYKRENVHWVSGYSDEVMRDDTLGYDIKYRENKDSNWIMVEVKNAVSDAFIISSREVEVGMAHKNSYQLALIKHNEIFMVRDFFLNSGWAKDLFIEGDYTAVPKDWFVSYVID